MPLLCWVIGPRYFECTYCLHLQIFFSQPSTLKDRGFTFLRNVGNWFPSAAASYPRVIESNMILKDRGSTFLRNVGNWFPSAAASYPRKSLNPTWFLKLDTRRPSATLVLTPDKQIHIVYGFHSKSSFPGKHKFIIFMNWYTIILRAVNFQLFDAVLFPSISLLILRTSRPFSSHCLSC